MSGPAILVAIINYRTPSLAIEALRSIIPELDGEHRRAVLVDNGSADGSAERLALAITAEGWQDRVALLPLVDNRGFGAGNNAAVAYAGTHGFAPDLIWFLNPDAIAAPDALAELVAFFAAHPQAGIAGTAIDDPKGSTVCSAFRFPTPLGEMESVLGLAFVTRLLEPKVIAPEPLTAVATTDWVSGASLMIRTALYERLGGFDEGYFLYFEETDLCRRAAALGASCHYVPDARVIHLSGQSSGATEAERNRQRRPLHWFQSRARYYHKHLGRGALLYASLAWLLAYPPGRIMAHARGRASVQPPRLWRDMLRYGWR